MLVPCYRHPWDLSPKEAMELQRELAKRVILEDRGDTYRTVAGIDVGIEGKSARAAVVVMALPELSIMERVVVERLVTFPYVPGLLSFREAPAILEALARLQCVPDVLIFDGQGYAHPRRMGIATHVGILLDHPTIGCAKSRLCGTYEEPAPARGSHTGLWDRGEMIGAIVRTRAGVKPVFVSVGHRIRLDTAISLVMRCAKGYRLPEPTRWAHRLASGGL